MKTKNAIILCSGGLDSVVTAHYVKKKLKYERLIILFFDYGQRTVNQERIAVRLCANDLKSKFVEIKLDFLGKISTSLINKKEKANKVSRKQLHNTKKEADNYYVPCRNTIFLSKALALVDAAFIDKKRVYDIFLGFKSEGSEGYPDTTKEFVKQMNKIGAIGCSRKFKIIAPLISKDKDEIVKLGQRLSVNLPATYSCYIGAGKMHCGYCLNCRLRQEAFYWANIRDKTMYKERLNDFRLAD